MNALNELKNLTILIADDDVIFLESTCKILEMLFDKVLIAKNGHEALRLFQEHTVHMLMLDIRMGELSGIEVAQHIRKVNTKIPIFLVSSYTQTDELIEACKLNLISYMVKPFSFQTLSLTLEECVLKLKKECILLVHLTSSVSYDPFQKKLLVNGAMEVLNHNEILVLELLIQYRKQIITYQSFYNILGEETTYAALKNIILRLRKKVGENAIRNLSKVGYTLI
jgi:DNA-binding response OmpR family regulator